ncbi:MAG: DEAD/DEAH box helicase [Pseudoclavibacter sp.]
MSVEFSALDDLVRQSGYVLHNATRLSEQRRHLQQTISATLVTLEDEIALLPLNGNVWALLDIYRRLSTWDQLPRDLHTGIQYMVLQLPAIMAAARDVSGFRRLFRSSRQQQLTESAQQQVRQWHDWALAQLPAPLHTCAFELDQPAPQTLPAPEALVGLLSGELPDSVHFSAVLSPAELTDLAERLAVCDRVEGRLANIRRALTSKGAVLRERLAREVLRTMPIDRLTEATEKRLSLAPLTQHDLHSVQDIIEYERWLSDIPGIGEATAQRIAGAARTIETMTRERMVIRPKSSERTPEMTWVLRQAQEALTLEHTFQKYPQVQSAGVTLMSQTLSAAHTAANGLLIAAPSQAGLEQLWKQARLLCEASEAFEAADASHSTDDALWREFSRTPLPYLDLLGSLGFTVEDQEARFGGLPEEIIERIREQDLDVTGLAHSIRGYQQFAARFVLVQRKVIIGDEMGLGKTVEALTVLSHIWARSTSTEEPPRHFLVICPAAVVANWTREAQKWTDLPVQRLHGDGRAFSFQMWRRSGGIAVTTYGTVDRFDMSDIQLACIIVDEAHLIKNPKAQRSIAAGTLIDQADRAVLLTGTPLENRVAEFMTLASYVDLRFRTDDWPPLAFRQAIAPIYLRRNQEDVLTELPPLLEKDDWVGMTQADRRLYEDEVLKKNFMGMRRAPLMAGKYSGKVDRLLDILTEVQANGRKALVFSYFRSVLKALEDVLAQHFDVHGPLTGSIPAAKRQDLVDQFAQAPAGAVLLSQIQAGGVGMNIQAASVVVLCEPQLKPTIEDQAIARAHRQGQQQTVVVHRLLSDVGADARLVQLLRDKREIFDSYARTSVMAERAPEATDLSESEIAVQIIKAERERLGFDQPPTETGRGVD